MGWSMLRPETEGFYMRSMSKQAQRSGGEAISTILSPRLRRSLMGRFSTVAGVLLAVSRTGSLVSSAGRSCNHQERADDSLWTGLHRYCDQVFCAGRDDRRD